MEECKSDCWHYITMTHCGYCLRDKEARDSHKDSNEKESFNDFYESNTSNKEVKE